MNSPRPQIQVRHTRKSDFPGIIALCREVYTDAAPWSLQQLASHLEVFPEGQFVAVERGTGKVMGMAASLIVKWDDYDDHASWREFTEKGLFTNHDPIWGRTLYGAEVMVSPRAQRSGIGSKIYKARSDLATHLGLRRIRAAARLRGYHRFHKYLSAEEYVTGIVHGNIKDPTLSFQMKHGFTVIDVVADYLLHDDRASHGYAAIIEWLNPHYPAGKELEKRDRRFLPDA